MIEKQLEESMHSALAGEPPLGFDPDEVVDRAARRQRQRRSAFATAGVAGGVLVLAVTTVLATSSREQGTGIGTPPTSTTTTTRGTGVCQGVAPGHIPPSGFPGSAAALARIDEAAPGVLTTHLGLAAAHADEMAVYDCPPNISGGFTVAGTPGVVLAMTHARPELDFEHDQLTDADAFRLLRDTPQPDGGSIRVYVDAADESGALIVARYGADGMNTEVSVPRRGQFAEQDLVALVSDPGLRFPLPR